MACPQAVESSVGSLVPPARGRAGSNAVESLLRSVCLRHERWPSPTPSSASLIERSSRRTCLTLLMKSTQEITQQVQVMGQWISPLREQIGHVVIGQKYLVDRLLLGLLANGHILLEGVPGLAKSLTVKTMAAC